MTQINLTYRPGTADDTRQMKALAVVSYGQYAPLLKPEQAEKFISNLQADETWSTLLGMSKSIVCSCDNKIAGMAFLIPGGNAWDIFKAEWAYVRLLGIHPDYEGKGIATALMKQCIEQARAANEKTLALHTSEMMAPARHIYEKLGFKILREIEPRFGKRYWLYTLHL